MRTGGTWVYTNSRQPVPGAEDVTFGRRYAGAPRATRDDGEVVLLDRDWLEGPDARPELRWCIPLATLGSAATVEVPVDEILARSEVVVGLWAPELDPAALLTASAIARLLGVTRSTVNAYHARQQMPPPIVTLNQRVPLWTRPIIDHWAARQTRRRRPAL
ncbi:helix-turn-helix transcriptional regulator [Jiangella endophytica]|uniref:helix-turn-helix transcriptional regulator n=1 Tax=Jiangella endophytica TaxID=1623398 RepID=UPI0013004AAE|nr:hypothetical protein [Jiangella endophytica]